MILQQQQQRPFNGLWSGTTRVGRYQKELSPTHTHPDHRVPIRIIVHPSGWYYIITNWLCEKLWRPVKIFGDYWILHILTGFAVEHEQCPAQQVTSVIVHIRHESFFGLLAWDSFSLLVSWLFGFKYSLSCDCLVCVSGVRLALVSAETQKNDVFLSSGNISFCDFSSEMTTDDFSL